MVKVGNISQDVVLAPLTTMKVGGAADFFTVVHTPAEVKVACDWAATSGIGVFVLGEGSNVVVSDDGVHRLVIKNEIRGVEKVSENKDSLTMKIGAGEHWDDVVERAVELNLSGIEAMSGIPGSTGAAPVQNAGAYGQEIADVLVELAAYDTDMRCFVTLSPADCEFGYRTSAFKSGPVGRYIILYVTIKLYKHAPHKPSYESLKRYLDARGISEPNLRQIREGVLAVRARILPDPTVVPNVGSFFESPVVSAQSLKKMESKFGAVPSYRYGDGFKIPAGWIVEQCGFKGSEHFGFKVWDQHALVITNPSGGRFAELMKVVDLIVTSAKERFGLDLETEPLVIR